MAIQFFLTDAGRAAGLDAENLDLHLSLSHIAVGTGKYNAATTASTKTALTNELARYPLNGGGVETISHTLRFVVNIESAITADIFELGLYTDTGVLFAVAAITGNIPLVQLVTNIVTILTIGITFADIDVSTVQIVMDANSPVSVALMNQHLGHADPHPQYPLKSVLADAIFHVGYRLMTGNSSYNPAIALKPLFGYETTWYLWPYVPAGVANTSAALGQIIPLTAGNDTQAATTRIWERLPDGASAPTYTLTANQSTVDEGEQVTFTLSTTGIAQGTAVAWNITGIQSADISPNAMSGQFVVGADGKASKTITIIADQTTEGTETLKFALTYISGKFVNVTISDTSIQAEQIVTINTDQPAGVNLRSDFVQLYGQPTANTKAVFIIESGVTIVAPTPESAAIYCGVWPSGSTREIRIMSNALVVGRGGKGGQAIDYDDSPAAKAGQDGGTAIEAETGSPVIVNNYGLIAGGGGGGGASGCLSGSSQGNPPDQISSGIIVPGSGGAPYGLSGSFSKNRIYDEGTWSGCTLMYFDSNSTRRRWWYDQIKWNYILGEGDPNTAIVYSTNPVPWATSTLTVPASTDSMDVFIYGDGKDSKYKGGVGGYQGQNGLAGTITVHPPKDNIVWSVYSAPGAGGLAGYIYQGPVTINNLGSGQTKGRTP